MGLFKVSERAISDTLFALCLQLDAAFEQRLLDAIQAAGLQIELEEEHVDHQELLIYHCWLAHRVFPDRPKVMNALQASSYLASINPTFKDIDGQQLFQYTNKRYYEYDQAMSNASNPLDIIYVNRIVTPRIFSQAPHVLVH